MVMLMKLGPGGVYSSYIYPENGLPMGNSDHFITDILHRVNTLKSILHDTSNERGTERSGTFIF